MCAAHCRTGQVAQDGTEGPPQERCTPLELEAQFGEERNGGVDVFHHDADVVHALDRHDASRASNKGIVTPRARQAVRDYTGTYVSLIASSPMRSLSTRRSGGWAPAKYGLPRPSTTGRR